MPDRAFDLREPCACGSTAGRIENRNGQNCVFCVKCDDYQYNAPRAEVDRYRQSAVEQLAAFLNARLDEDERWAFAASPGPWSESAESTEVLAADGITVADGFALSSNQLRATVAHIARHDPARVLREVAAKRRLLERYERVLRSKAANDAAQADLAADLAHEERTGVWAGPGLPDVRLRALRREEDYLTAMLPVLEGLVKATAAVYDDSDYREEWRP